MLVVLAMTLCLPSGQCHEWDVASWRGPQSAVQCEAVAEQLEAEDAVCVIQIGEE